MMQMVANEMETTREETCAPQSTRRREEEEEVEERKEREGGEEQEEEELLQDSSPEDVRTTSGVVPRNESLSAFKLTPTWSTTSAPTSTIASSKSKKFLRRCQSLNITTPTQHAITPTQQPSCSMTDEDFQFRQSLLFPYSLAGGVTKSGTSAASKINHMDMGAFPSPVPTTSQLLRKESPPWTVRDLPIEWRSSAGSSRQGEQPDPTTVVPNSSSS